MKKIILSITILFLFTSLVSANQKLNKKTDNNSTTTSFKLKGEFNLQKNISRYSSKEKSTESNSYQKFDDYRGAGFGLLIPGGILLYLSLQIGIPFYFAMGGIMSGPYFLMSIAYMMPFIIVWFAIGAVLSLIGIICFFASGYYFNMWLKENRVTVYNSLEERTPSANIGLSISL